MAKIGSAKLYIALAVLAIVFLPPFAKYQELSYKNRKLEEKIETLKKANEALECERLRLEQDIVYIEGRAREKIGLVKKGEIVLKQGQRK